MDIFERGSKGLTRTVNDVTVRSMTAGERARLESAITRMTDGKKTPRDMLDIRWLALSACCIDENGDPVFQKDDRDRFGELQTWFVEPIFEAILELSGVSESDREEFEGN